MRANWMVIGALSGALGVALAAWGAHGMEEVVTEAEPQAWWHTGVRIQMWHAAPLFLAGWLSMRDTERPRGTWMAGPGLFLGTVLFSGSLYAMALGAPRWFGAITPIGGLALILGWIGLAWGGLGRRPA